MYLQAKKSLGQHFLNSKHVLGQIIEAANIKEGEHVLEIGPGTGVLTEALLNAGAIVTAIEKDDRAIEELKAKFRDFLTERLKIIHGDILDDSTLEMPDGPYSIVANIPYYITGAILEKFLESPHKPDKMVLLVQKEVADRIVANDGKESILSVSVKAFGKPKIVAKVPPGAFTPPPTVDSAILAIENISGTYFEENSLEIPRFFAIVKAAFAHKRKFAARNLESLIPPEKVTATWQNLDLDPKIRAEDVPVDKWAIIAKNLL
jgi:16S rRNA (adenine1518-N6/adenine1519-N6)-dimethyltransferase